MAILIVSSSPIFFTIGWSDQVSPIIERISPAYTFFIDDITKIAAKRAAARELDA